MHFKQFLYSLPRTERDLLAKSCKTTGGHLQNIAYGYRVPSPELCVLLETKTDGSVTRQELVENWQAIWPELATQQKRAA